MCQSYGTVRNGRHVVGYFGSCSIFTLEMGGVHTISSRHNGYNAVRLADRRRLTEHQE